jgi:hypothetical protein
MSTAAERTREAVRTRPFLYEALRAGVVNYSAAAELLGLDADVDTVAAALRRYAADLPPLEPERRRGRVTMRRGVGVRDAADGDDPLLRVGAAAVVDEGDATALVVDGDVDGRTLAHVVSRLETEGRSVAAAGVAEGSLVVVVEDRGAAAVRTVEESLGAVPGGPV